jgi:hypothetical protein
MATQQDFFEERAAEARAVADAATLSNVRDRWLLSEARWTEMAERSARVEKRHEGLIAEKAEERAEALAAKQALSE